MKKKIAAVIALVLLICITATGCTEANQVSYNISKEADNFNVTRKLTVLNARTDTILLELTGLLVGTETSKGSIVADVG